MRKVAVNVVVFVGFPSLMMAAGSMAAELRMGPVFLDRFPEVQAVLEDPAAELGSPLPKASDLTLLEDGRATVPAGIVRTFRDTGQGLAIVVAVDVSRTMDGKPIEQTRQALLSLLKDLKPRDRVALVSFADDVRVEALFGTPTEKAQARINELAPRGRITELYRALFKSLSLFTSDLPARRRILVISDGRDEGEAYQLDDVIRLAKDQEVPVDAIGLTRIDPKYLSNLERLADLTGGSYSPAGGTADVESLVRKGLERVRSSPVATFTVQDLRQDDQPHRLGVRWRQGGRVREDETQVTLARPPTGTPETTEPGLDSDRRETVLWGGVVALLLLVVAVTVWRTLSSRRRLAAPLPSVPATPPGQQPVRRQPPPAALDLPLAAGATPPTEWEPQAPPPPIPSPKPRTVRHKTQIRHEFATPSSGHPAAVLAEEESAAGRTFPIEVDPFWIGAAEDNQIVLEQDQFLSSHHACIRFQDGSLLLYDNRSTNGTYVNGERLAEIPRPLGVGDRIRVGHSTFVVLTP